MIHKIKSHQSTKHQHRRSRTKHTISTPVIQFTSGITLGDIDLGEIADTGDLDVFRGLDEMHTLEGAVGDGAGATAGLCAVSNVDTFGITDGTKVG